MSEPDALVARITISPGNLERWLDSQVPPLETWAQDWEDWWYCLSGERCSPSDILAECCYPEIRSTVRELVEYFRHRNGWKSATWSQSNYEEQTNVWRLLAIEVSENCGQMLGLLAPFRAVEAFSESDKDDYIAFTNCFYSPESEYSPAAVQFIEGKSVMLKEPKLPASFLHDIRDQFHKAEKDRVITVFQHDAWVD